MARDAFLYVVVSSEAIYRQRGSLVCHKRRQGYSLIVQILTVLYQQTERQAQTPKSTKSKQSNGQVRSISAQFLSTNLSPSVASPSVRYSSRTNSGAVVASYGATDITWTARQSFQPEVCGYFVGIVDCNGGGSHLNHVFFFMQKLEKG